LGKSAGKQEREGERGLEKTWESPQESEEKKAGREWVSHSKKNGARAKEPKGTEKREI